MKTFRGRLLLVWWAVLLAMPAWAADSDYLMGTGDVLRITVYGQPDLATEARVSERGSITFPLIGDVKMSGVTPAQGQSEIAARLAKGGFIIDPFVTVNVVQYRGQQVSVLGRVNRPGRYNLERASRIADVLALAGGVVADGADAVTLVREHNGRTEYREIDLVALLSAGGEAANERVQDGDTLNVARQPVFYIYGEVQRPGAFRLERNMNVVQALSLGGGVTQRGTQKGIRVLRRDGAGPMREIEVKLDDPVRKDDVIYVKESLF